MFIWMPPTEAPDSRPAVDNEPENPPSTSDSFVLPDSVAWRAIRDFAGMLLRWQPLKVDFRQQTYELHCGEEILGLMHCEVNRWSSPRAWRGRRRVLGRSGPPGLVQGSV